MFSLIHDDTSWSNTAEECRAQTLSDARLAPRLCRARTFHERTTQPPFHAAGSWARTCERAPETLLGRMHGTLRGLVPVAGEATVACRPGLLGWLFGCSVNSLHYSLEEQDQGKQAPICLFFLATF